MLIKLIGFIIILDGILSIGLVRDKRFLWQAGRVIRIILGIILMVIR